MTWGDTPAQALLMLEDARLTMLDHLLKYKLPIPKPNMNKSVVWDNEKGDNDV